jgi:hypothetical protein
MFHEHFEIQEAQMEGIQLVQHHELTKRADRVLKEGEDNLDKVHQTLDVD